MKLEIDELMNRQRPVHIIGAGGVGMSGLALLLAKSGYIVTASDKNDSPYLQKLKKEGITTTVGSDTTAIKANAVVFHSSAVPQADTERQYCEQAGLPVFSRHPLLGFITRQFFTIAVAGAHGKTTTSAWVADMLVKAGFDPNALIGGSVRDWGSNFRTGQGQINGKHILVIEADESDSSFLDLDADIAMITNIDLDHVDRFASFEQVQAEYTRFTDKVTGAGGKVILSSEIKNYTESNPPNEKFLQIKAQQWQQIVKQYQFKVPGEFNKKNFSLLYQLARLLGISDTVLHETASEFSGVKRRLEVRSIIPVNHGQISVIDDYGHHPVEIENVLQTLNSTYKKVVAVWEPHRYSRFMHFYDDFAGVFKKHSIPGLRFLLPIFASSDKLPDFPGFQSKLENLKTNLGFVSIPENDYSALWEAALQNTVDCIVFLGAGRSSEFLDSFLDVFTEPGR